MNRLIAGLSALTLAFWSPLAAAAPPSPKPSLCKPQEQVVTSCHAKGRTWSLCGMDAPSRRYIVYRERAGQGLVTQFPQDEARYSSEFHLSTGPSSGGGDGRVRFRREGIEYYIVDSIHPGAPDFDRHGWPLNGTALIAMGPGKGHKYYCPVSDNTSIRALAYDLLTREEYNFDVP
jgi:hypothetical protein